MEQKLKEDFINFLKNKKNYSEDSFLFDHHIIDVVGKNSKKVIYTDLAILDTNSNNYLAFVEFKKNISVNLDKYNSYLRVLNNPDLTFYFVEQSEKNDFVIYIFKEKKLQQIPKEDFPNYKTLIAKSQADKKVEIEKKLLQNKKEREKKKRTLTTTLTATIMSLAVALTLTQSLDILNFKNSKKDKEIENFSKQIEIKLNNLKDKLSLIEIEKDTITISEIKIQSLKNRIQKIENLISQNPKNLLEIQQTENKFDIINLIIEKEKELNNQKIKNLEDKLNSYSNIIISLLVTFIGALLGYLFSVFGKDRKN